MILTHLPCQVTRQLIGLIPGNELTGNPSIPLIMRISRLHQETLVEKPVVSRLAYLAAPLPAEVPLVPPQVVRVEYQVAHQAEVSPVVSQVVYPVHPAVDLYLSVSA